MNTAYPLLPVSVITLLAYFTGLAFTRWGIFDKKHHRKFWNILLLITFVVSGILGLVSVVKVNYKLEIPYYEKLLKWHVALGIGMVFIAFFHLSWHWKYYFSLKKIPKTIGEKAPEYDTSNFAISKLGYLLFLLGFLAMINQIDFIREFISVMAGNELILGVVMAAWLLLSGFGAFSGRKRASSDTGLHKNTEMLLALSVLPALSIVLLYWLKSQLFPPGTITGIGTAILAAFLLLFPVCFLSGYLFTAFSTFFSIAKGKNLIGKSYAIESLGSLIGGLLFSLVLGRFFNAFQVFGLSAGLTSILTAWLVSSRLKGLSYFLTGIFVPALIFVFNPDTRIKKWLYPSQQITLNQSTPYGNLVVTRQASQLNFYENNALQFYTGNFMVSEESVHFAMSQHNNPRNILLLSGGISGMIREIQKYPVNKIIYLESNPGTFKYWKKQIEEDEYLKQVEFIRADIRSYLAKTNSIYDVILINLPEPSTLGSNRFYTQEFFKIIKRHCNQQTVICTSLPPTINYTEANALQVNASLWKTIGVYFSKQLLLTGEKNYFLASDSPLSPNVTELVAQKGIRNEYVNNYYIDDFLLSQRSKSLEKQIQQISKAVKINHDFSPFIFIKQTLHWLNHFGTSYYSLVIIPAVLFLLLFFRLNPVSIGLYTGGFTAVSMEITLMLGYQVFFGNLYLNTALFFAVFMGGLIAGSLQQHHGEKFTLIKKYAFLQFGLAVFSLLVPLFILLMEHSLAGRLLSQLLFFLLVFILAFGIGHEFFLASKLQAATISETSGLNYSTDLAGSAFGAFLTSIVLLPLLGLTPTCLIVAGMNLFSGTLAYFHVKT